MVEECMNLKIDKEGFNYSRFVSHMYYLLDRVANNKEIKTQNQKMFDQLILEYPQTYECAIRICKALEIKLNDEELLYLILHVNRLSSREETL
ncbi:PRD domain-containing protein [Dielma fastidiosa]|uniref:PRD domain-containing protein n=1 Tax=Dielma fastidiosa TaxID=1034346 RepID=UPI002A809C0C|nr:PRD domain-containing protein [Dielma fastidiosa]